jgi:hypothetical protein
MNVGVEGARIPVSSRFLLVFLAIFAIFGTAACAKRDISAAAPPAAQAEAKTGGAPASRHALLELHVTWEADIDGAQRAQSLALDLRRKTEEAGGFVETTSLDGDRAHLLLRAPKDKVNDVRAVLEGRGTMTRDDESTIDVTDAIEDTEARLRAARTEETRLLSLLSDHTGSVGDVLQAEKALADVRERIERLEASDRVARERVDLATIDVTLHFPAADGPLGNRFSDAAHDGVGAARAVSVGIALTALRAGPTLLLLAALAFFGVLIARRVNKSRARRSC